MNPASFVSLDGQRTQGRKVPLSGPRQGIVDLVASCDHGAMTARISVFLLDCKIVRCGLRDLLEEEDDVFFGEAGTEANTLGRVPALDPDAAVLELRRQEGNGMGMPGNPVVSFPDGLPDAYLVRRR